MPDVEDAGGEVVEKTGQETSDLSARIAAAVEAATSGLKDHNAKIIDEKRALKKDREELAGTLEALGGKDGVAGLLKMKAHLEQNELGKLLTEGKHDEWFDQRTESLRAGYSNQIDSLSEKISGAEERAKAAEGRHRDLLLDIDIRDVCAQSEGFVSSAQFDALLRARGVFVYDPERNQNVIRDSAGGVLPGKDGITPKSPAEWLEEQKRDSRHWWGESKGAGASGGRGGTESHEDLHDAMRNAKTQAEYTALREKQAKKKGKTSAGFGGFTY